MNKNKTILRKENTTRNYIESALMVALIAIGALISIPIGPVPITLQNFFIFMAALILKPKYATLSALVYALLGLLGLPIFAGFSGGPQSVLSPAFGFIIGFIPIAYLISKSAQGQKNPLVLLLILILADILLYIIGLPYMYLIMNKVNGTAMTFKTCFELGMVPFIIPDLVKAALAAFIGPKILGALEKF